MQQSMPQKTRHRLRIPFGETASANLASDAVWQDFI
jgi:hypothetical protein